MMAAMIGKTYRGTGVYLSRLIFVAIWGLLKRMAVVHCLTTTTTTTTIVKLRGVSTGCDQISRMNYRGA